jgi:hypothetical protein
MVTNTRKKTHTSESVMDQGNAGNATQYGNWKRGYFYLATPYSKYKDGIEEAFKEACKQTGYLIRNSLPVYSPIAHTHPIAIHSYMDPYDHSIWLKLDEPMMDNAYGLIVCMLDGWEDSYGVKHEIEHFTKAKKPIFYMEPFTVPEEIKAEMETY